MAVDLTISNHWIQSAGPFKMVLAEVVAVEDMLDMVTKWVLNHSVQREINGRLLNVADAARAHN